VQNPIPYCRGKVGEFALVHGLRAAHLSHGGIEQLSYLVEVPGGRARVSRKPVEFEQVRAAVARQRFGDEITGFLKAEIRHIQLDVAGAELCL
jgi:hypothetical protein